VSVAPPKDMDGVVGIAWAAFVALALEMGCPREQVVDFTGRFMAVHSSSPVTPANIRAVLTWMESEPWTDAQMLEFPDKQEGWSLAEITREYVRRWRER
jgi:hypothetical protein